MIVCAGVFVTPVLAAPESVPDAFSVDDLRTIETERDKALKRLEKLDELAISQFVAEIVRF